MFQRIDRCPIQVFAQLFIEHDDTDKKSIYLWAFGPTLCKLAGNISPDEVNARHLIHLTSSGLIVMSSFSNISQHSSVAFLYVAPILTYNQVPYLIQIMHVLITVSSTSMCACVYATAPRVLHNSASLLLQSKEKLKSSKFKRQCRMSGN